MATGVGVIPTVRSKSAGNCSSNDARPLASEIVVAKPAVVLPAGVDGVDHGAGRNLPDRGVDRLRVRKAAAGIDHDDALGRDDEAGSHVMTEVAGGTLAELADQRIDVLRYLDGFKSICRQTAGEQHARKKGSCDHDFVAGFQRAAGTA